jgi:hypothetical protein
MESGLIGRTGRVGKVGSGGSRVRKVGDRLADIAVGLPGSLLAVAVAVVCRLAARASTTGWEAGAGSAGWGGVSSSHFNKHATS